MNSKLPGTKSVGLMTSLRFEHVPKQQRLRDELGLEARLLF